MSDAWLARTNARFLNEIFLYILHNTLSFTLNKTGFCSKNIFYASSILNWTCFVHILQTSFSWEQFRIWTNINVLLIQQKNFYTCIYFNLPKPKQYLSRCCIAAILQVQRPYYLLLYYTLNKYSIWRDVLKLFL